MKFGRFPLDSAVGAYLAHAIVTPSGTLRKGTLLDEGTIGRIAAAGHLTVVAARLEPGDVHEDEAAGRLARALAGPGVSVEEPATGRSNLFAEIAGLLAVDAEVVDRFNRLDPAITIATRQPMRGVEAGRMVATVKIIPFAVPAAALEAAEAIARSAPAVTIWPYKPLKTAVVSTLLPSLKASVVDKTVGVLRRRLAPAGAVIGADVRISHEEGALAEALARVAPDHDLVVVFGASAVVDAGDVIPAAVEIAGGTVLHLGMPVDPGNLLLLAEIRGKPVLGAPGCARSPRENGFDWVLERILAGDRPTAADIMGMGVGGLLMDIVSRPAPRTGEARREDPDRPKIAAVVLAAGRSTRFGATKMLAEVGGIPMIRQVVTAALSARVADVSVVVGHDGERVAAAVADLPVRIVRNERYADGQATSVVAGIAAIPVDCEAAVILLGDMPGVDAATIERIVGAYRPLAGALVVVPVHEGRRGNPVLWSRRTFDDLMALEGDQGARNLLKTHAESVVTVEAGPGVLFDVDTPDALAAAARPTE